MVVLLRLVVLDARCRAPSTGPVSVLELADTRPRGHGRRLGTGPRCLHGELSEEILRRHESLSLSVLTHLN